MSSRRRGVRKRATEPGSFATTAGGIFLSYGAPTIAGLGLLGLVLGDRIIGGTMFIVGVTLTAVGHRMAGR